MIPLGKEYLAMESFGRDGRRFSGGEKLDHDFPPKLPDLQPHLLMLLLSSGKLGSLLLVGGHAWPQLIPQPQPPQNLQPLFASAQDGNILTKFQ